MKSVALITCAVLPEPDPDQELLLAALRAAGMTAELLAWDAPQRDPAEFDLLVLRSCWNYYRDAAAFVRWIDAAAAATRLYNPASVVHWNLHKRYLVALQESGVPVVPTLWFARGDEAALAAPLGERGWDDIVIKPAISAASFRTRRFGAGQLREADAFLASLLTRGDAMVQPYLSSVEDPGERALIWIDGELTHAVTKHPRFAGGEERVSAAQPVSGEEQELARRALACVPHPLLYARIDVVRDSLGEICVAELELMEPSLFLLQHPPAVERFVAAIANRARRPRSQS
jgi:hypothetical protein